MSALFDTGLNDAVDFTRLRLPIAQRPAAGPLEAFTQNWNFVKGIEEIGTMNRQRSRLLHEEIDLFEQLSGERFTGPDVDYHGLEGTIEEMGSVLAGEAYESEFVRRAQEWLAENPEYADRFQFEYERRTQEQMRALAQETAEVDAATVTLGAQAAGLAGAFVASMTDPTILIVSLGLGGLLGAVGRVSLGRALLVEGALGAGIEAAATPYIMRQREVAGLEYTWDQALVNIVLSGVASAGFYAGIRTLPDAAQFIRDRSSGVGRNERALLDYLDGRIVEMQDNPFLHGTRADAARLVNQVDRVTADLISGRVVSPWEVNTTQVGFGPIRTLEQNARLISQALMDPDERAAFLRQNREAASILDAAVRTAQERANAVVTSAEGRSALARVEPLQVQVRDLSAKVRELEELNTVLRSTDPVDERLLAYIDDELTRFRLEEIFNDLRADNLPARRKRALEDEARTIVESARAEIGDTLSTALRQTQDQLRTRTQDLSMAANNLRQTREYRKREKAERRALAQDVAAKFNQLQSTGELRAPYSATIEPTPYKAAVDDLRTNLVRAVEEETPPIRIEERQEVALRSLDEGEVIAFTDFVTGEVRMVTGKDLADEVAAARNFLKEFEACRGKVQSA